LVLREAIAEEYYVGHSKMTLGFLLKSLDPLHGLKKNTVEITPVAAQHGIHKLISIVITITNGLDHVRTGNGCFSLS